MNKNPRLLIDLNKIFYNTRTVVNMCASLNVDVFGVTKGVCGDPRVAQAMLDGGVKGLADARIENIKRLRAAGIKGKLMLLRSPMLSEIDDVISCCDISLNSEPEVLRILSERARVLGLVHSVILMIDVGEIREGILPANIFRVGDCIKGLRGIKVAGIGTNLACYSGVRPTLKNMNLLLDTKRELEAVLEYKIPVVSGGNSSSLELINSRSLPQGINQLRIGESILLGHYILEDRPIEYTHQDAFMLIAELIELKEKPSVPLGVVGKNTFGGRVNDEELRIHYRGIAAIGRQDVPPDAIYPVTSGCKTNIDVKGATSDHVVLDFGEVNQMFSVGSEIKFNLSYPGLLATMTSPYVYKEYICEK